MLNTDPYGGGLWHTWFDRDLGIAGKVILKSENGGLFTRLLRIDSPVARIPNLAIHLTDRSTPFSPNLHEHCKAILTMESSSINCESSSDSQERLHPFLLQLVSDKLCVSPDVIVDMELQLIDIQPPTLGGANNELLFSGRLDNLCSSYQCLRALIDGASEDLVSQENIRLITLFDHEEVGSGSCVGAGSPMFLDTLKSINQHLTDGSHCKLCEYVPYSSF
jgi:aspartyl aminopeptidase